jgi:hypothetical protein
LKGGAALVIDGTATTKAALFPYLERSSALGGFRTHIKTEVNSKDLKITDRKELLSVGYPTLTAIAISIRGHPRIVE